MTILSLASLLVQQTKDEIYAYALGVANAISLPVTSWQAGDPTRAQFQVEAETLATLEEVAAGYISSGFLDYAHGDWLKFGAKQTFNVDVPGATYATTDVVLTNGGGGLYNGIAAGDLTFKSSVSGKTYRNTTGGNLASGPGTTLTVTVVADEAGSASSAGAGEITTLVTSLLGVTCTNALSAIGIDEQDESVTIAQCRAKLGSLSPNGPSDAYAFVAREPTYSLTSGVTRVRVYGDSTTGAVTVYLAGPSGGVSSTDRALVQTAILKYATPLCITPTVLAATNVVVPVTYTLYIYKSCNKTAAQVAADILAALQTLVATRPIGGDIIPPATTGKLYASMIASTIRGVFPQAFNVTVTLPAGDTSITNGQVATLGTVTPTINIVVDPS
jgi:Baseplate J-like protein